MQAKQQKDPKKQEAGRKSAEARRKKMEALKAELTAGKETVFYKNNKEVPETVPKEHVDAPKLQAAEQRVSEHSEGTLGWIMGISLAVLIGAVLYTRRSAPLERRQLHIVPHEPQECNTVATTQSAAVTHAVQPSWSLFDME